MRVISIVNPTIVYITVIADVAISRDMSGE